MKRLFLSIPVFLTPIDFVLKGAGKGLVKE